MLQNPWELDTAYIEMLKGKHPSNHLSASGDTQEHLGKFPLVPPHHQCKRKQVFLLKVFDSFVTDKSLLQHSSADNYLAIIAIKIK